MSLINGQIIREFIIYTLLIFLSAILWLMFPIFSLIAMVVIPVSIALMLLKLDIKLALASLLINLAALSLITGQPLFVLYLLLQTGPVGILMGLIFKRKYAWGKGLVIVVMFAVLGPAGMYMTDYFVTGSNPFLLDNSSLVTYRQGVQELRESFNLGSGTGKVLSPSGSNNELDNLTRQFEAALPVLAMASGIIWFMSIAAICYFAVWRLLIRLKYPVALAIPFSFWHLPWYFVWGVILGLAMLLLGAEYDFMELSSLGKVFLWVMGYVFAVIGTSVFAFFVKILNFSWIIKLVGLFFMLLFLPHVVAVMSFVGIVDTLGNIRRLTRESRKPEEDEVK
ncbi:MAG: DUF2232 domain-containing protein [Peptococcaceae bacterium]|nr:DUF2232 domain-containing protein [Peptococcaceae bacterium]